MKRREHPLFVGYLKKFQAYYRRAEISMQAAAITYFMILATLPILLVMANILPLLPLPVEWVQQQLAGMLPQAIFQFIWPLLDSYLSSVNGTAISIGLLAALWSTSKIFNALQSALNRVYGVSARKNYVIMRAFSLLLTFFVIVLMIALALLFVFGNQVLMLLQQAFHWNLDQVLGIFENARWLLGIPVSLLVFSAIYYLVPNVRWPFRYSIPGSIFTTVGFLAISQLFSLYVSFSGSQWTGNGTFGLVIMFTFWLYLLAQVVVYGALINVLCYEMVHAKKEKKESI